MPSRGCAFSSPRPSATFGLVSVGLRLFLSYRRRDCASWATLLSNELKRRVDGLRLFQDVDNIPFGLSFRDVIVEELRQCDGVLVLVGPQWDPGRLVSPSDPVRLEIETARELGLILIPVLVDGATMPRTEELPDELEWLAFVNAAPVRPAPDFDGDLDRLIRRGLTPLAERSAQKRADPVADGPEPPRSEPVEVGPAEAGTPATRPETRVRALAVAVALAIGLGGGAWLLTPRPPEGTVRGAPKRDEPASADAPAPARAASSARADSDEEANRERGPRVMYPDWLMEGSGAFRADGRVLRGVAVASGIRNASLARVTATHRARAELSKVFDTYRAALVTRLVASSDAGFLAKDRSLDTVEQVLRTVSANLAQAEASDHWLHPMDGSTYAVTQMELDRFEAMVERHEQIGPRLEEAVLRASEAAFSDLLSESRTRKGR